MDLLLMVNDGANRFLLNDGNGNFTDASLGALTSSVMQNLVATFGDLDGEYVCYEL